jgi:hypothetical protein
MKKNLIFLLVLGLSSVVYAQRTRDVVMLHNGSILRGTITMQNDTVLLIATGCDNVFAVYPPEIREIASEKVVDPERTVTRKGYTNTTSLGVLIGTTDDAKSAPFSAIMEHNYRFGKNIALGGFHGFEQLNENLMPVGLNLKVMWPAGRSDFFIAINGGYSISLEKPEEQFMEKASGGMLAGTEVGLLIPVSRNSALLIAFGYRYNELNYRLDDEWFGNTDRHITYNRFSIRFGVTVW